MIVKEETSEARRVRVTFRLPLTLWAERVNLVGDFNDWDTVATPMERCGYDDRRWEAVLDLEGGRSYRFRYLVDGQKWLNDWHADRFVPNEVGSLDSVVDLPQPAHVRA